MNVDHVKNLNIFFQNASGIRTKTNTIFLSTSINQYDVFVFVETWLNNNINDAEIFDLNLYKVFRKDRDNFSTGLHRGGGVMIAIKKSFISNKVLLINQELLLDQLCISVSLDVGLFYICVSYIPPQSHQSLYIDHIDNITNLISSMSVSDNICVLGDFNLPDISWTIDSSKFFLIPSNYSLPQECYVIDNLLGSDLIQINSFTNENNKILDLIFISSNINYNLHICSFPFMNCDRHHRPLQLTISAINFSNVKRSRNETQYNFNLCNVSAITQSITNIQWHSVFQNTDLKANFSFLCDVIRNQISSHVPVSRRFKYKIPWHTKSLKIVKNCRNKYRKLFLQSGCISFRELYRFYMRKTNLLSKVLHSSYMSNLEKNIKTNPKTFWNYVKSKKSCSSIPTKMFLDSQSSTDLDEICNMFASFFKSNFAINNSYDCRTSPFNVPSILDIGSLSVSEYDVSIAIAKLNNSKKMDIDGFCPFFLKTFVHCLCTPLCLIFNKSLSLGIFLDNWKHATISPIFKKGNKSDITNYRPISKLSTISKIFENIIMTKLSFICKNVICDNQHGFVKNRSTVTNLSIFVSFCYNSFSRHKSVHTIYTDFSKAFDRVSHYLLHKKLSALGFHSTFLKWIDSYISERKCIVTLEGHHSDTFIATSGVPQGSILGPLLFVLFINDIVLCFKNSYCLLYADDLKIYRNVNNLIDAQLLQSDLDSLSLWCDINQLNLNVTKCFSLCLSKLKNNFTHTYSINNVLLQNVDQISDLGVTFDPSLTFNLHLNNIIPKAHASLGFIMRHSSNFKDPYTLKILYVTLVRSILEYAVIIWNPFYDIHINRLERVQRRFTKFALRALNIPSDTSYLTRNLLLGLDSLELRRNYLSLIFVRDIACGEVDCSSLLGALNFYVPPRLLRHANIFNISHCSSNYALNEPITRVSKLYNSISLNFEINFCLTKNNFKSELLNFLRSK